MRREDERLHDCRLPIADCRLNLRRIAGVRGKRRRKRTQRLARSAWQDWIAAGEAVFERFG